MPSIYEVELPDGRILEVEGDRPPTKAELAKFMGEQAKPQRTPAMESMADLLRERGGFAPAQSDIARRASSQALATTARYAPALVPGGPVGGAASGAGELIASTIETGKPDMAQAAASTASGLIPFSQARGIWPAIKNTAKTAIGVYGGERLKQAISGEENQAATTAGIAAALTAMSPLLGKAAGKAMGVVDPEDAARMATARINNQEKDAVLARMQAKGARVVPSSVNPSIKNKVLESIAGIENVQAGVARENQPLFNAMGRREAGLAADSPINETTLAASRQKIADSSYAAARRLGFGDELDKWRSAATKLREAEKKIAGGKFTTERGKAIDDAEKALADAEAALNAKANTPDAVAVMEQAKQAFGKNYDVEQAVLSGTDEVRPGILSALLEQRGEAGVSGELRDMAQFNNAYGRSAKNPTKLATAPGAASAGTAMIAGGGNPVQTAALVGGVPVVREAIRDMLTSAAYQAKNARRNYTPKTTYDPATINLLARMMELRASNSNQGR